MLLKLDAVSDKGALEEAENTAPAANACDVKLEEETVTLPVDVDVISPDSADVVSVPSSTPVSDRTAVPLTDTRGVSVNFKAVVHVKPDSVSVPPVALAKAYERGVTLSFGMTRQFVKVREALLHRKSGA
jgi:hypothetical protein